jgi:molybdopterin converting factor small subunit
MRDDEPDVDRATELIGTDKSLTDLTPEEQAVVEELRRQVPEEMDEVEGKLRRGELTDSDE